MKANFIYPLNLVGDNKSFMNVTKMVVNTIDTSILLSRARPSLKKVTILIDPNLQDVRVDYSSVTGIIRISPLRTGISSGKLSVRSNLIFALGMAFYDFSLKQPDRTYWRNLIRGKKIPFNKLLPKISFSTTDVGRDRLSFAYYFFMFQRGVEKEDFINFFKGEADFVTLKANRFRGFGRFDEYDVMNTPSGKTYTLKEALDLSGITAITPDLKAYGCKFVLDWDERGILVFKATKNGVPLVKIKRDLSWGVTNDHFFIAPELQRNGFGLKVFASQLTQAIRANIPQITTEADRDDSVDMVGYDVWWRFGFDGNISAYNTTDPDTAEDWFKEATNAKILDMGGMSVRRLFADFMEDLRQRAREGSFSPSALEYLETQVLERPFKTREDYDSVGTKEFLQLINFFNRMSPSSPLLKQYDLSHTTQRIQRLMELEGFSEWWAINGKKWRGVLDLREGEQSPVVGQLRNYMTQRGIQ